MKIQCLLYWFVLLLSYPIEAQVVDRVWKKEQDRFSLGIVVGMELDYFTTKIDRDATGDDLLCMLKQEMIAPCAGVELSYKLNRLLFLTASPLIRFSKSEIQIKDDMLTDADDVSGYKWGSVILPLCLKLKGESVKNTRPIFYVGGFGLVNPCKDPTADLVVKKWMSCGIQFGIGWEFPTKYITFVPEVMVRLAFTDVFAVKRKSLSELPNMELKKASSIRMNMVSFTLNLE
ncbi:MAG: hypothetical protein ACRCT5_05445 [Tannerellaceae bacterium]